MLLLASSADATRLYATTTSLASPPGLYEVNPATGASSFIDDVAGRLWDDVTGRLGDTAHLYGVAREPGAAYRNVVSTLDVQSGEVTDLFEFFPADFGFTSGESFALTGISIAPSLPSIATISAFIINPDFSATTILFDLDLGTGATSNQQTLDNVIYDLTHDANDTLFGVADGTSPGDFRVATIDRATAHVSLKGPCGCLAFQSMDFDLDANELLVHNSNGQLIRVSPATGSALGTVGPTGLGNSVIGLAFVGVPEPASGLLVSIGLVGYGLASKGRGGSRTRSRRA